MTTQTVLQGDEALAYVKSLEARQDVVTLLGAKQGFWNQAITPSGISYNFSGFRPVNGSEVLMTPIYNNLGNGWTEVLIPNSIVSAWSDGALAFDTFVIDSVSGYIYASETRHLDYNEWERLKITYNCEVPSNIAVYMSDNWGEVYVTYLSNGAIFDEATSSYSETGYYYFKYPSNITGLTFAIPTLCVPANVDMQVGWDGSNPNEFYANNSTFMNNCIFFKIN